MKTQKTKTQVENPEKKILSINNPMRKIEIEKIVLNCGGTEDKLQRSVKLLETITGRKACKTKATKRIPDFGISPGKNNGVKVTIRKKEEINSLLRRFFAALDNKLSLKQIRENQVSFGIKEYIEVPGLEYSREIGMLGFELSIVFKRKGKRVKIKKIKGGKYPKKQDVTREEIIDFLDKNFSVEVER